MFCIGCGQEIPSDAIFCPKCGKPQQGVPSPPASHLRAPVGPAPRPPAKGKGVWWLHTSDWQAACPNCTGHYTSETARCPNDDSPLVVAFDGRKLNPLAFPIHTAELRCLGNCGYRTQAFSCPADGTVLAEANVSFRMPLLRSVLHNLVYLTSVVLGLCLGALFVATVAFLLWWAYHDFTTATKEKPSNSLIHVFILMIGLGFFRTTRLHIHYVHWMEKCFRDWWPFKRRFRFDEAMKASRSQQKAEAREEAVRTHRYVNKI